MPEPRQYNGNPQGDQPRDDLDVAFSIIRPSEYIDLLEQINFGTGYYEDGELEHQIGNIRNGIVADIMFNQVLREHAIRETKTKLADDGFQYVKADSDNPQIWKPLDELPTSSDYTDMLDKRGRTTVLLKRGDEIWRELSRPDYSLSLEQAAALDDKANMSDFKPIFSQLAAVYHELTKSKGARTQDNFFGRVKRRILNGDVEQQDQGRRFLGRGGGRK